MPWMMLRMRACAALVSDESMCALSTSSSEKRVEEVAAARTSTRGEVRTRSDGRVEVTGHNGEVLSRTRTQVGDIFDIPASMVPKGWSYQWNAVSIAGNSDILLDQTHMMHQNGWRPVPAKRHNGHWMPKDHDGPIIVRGQALMERPEEMCVEAANEDKRRAIQQMRDRDESLMGAKANLRGAMRDGFEMGAKYRGTGGSLKMSIDPALDVPMPSHKLAEPGE